MRSILSLLLVILTASPSTVFAQAPSAEEESLPRWARFGGEDADEIKGLCSDVIDKSSGKAFNNLGDKSQKAVHCTAAYNAGFTSRVQKILTAGWAATAAVCWTACAVGQTPYGKAFEQVCTFSNLGQGVNDMVTGLATQKVLKQSVDWAQTSMGLVTSLVTTGMGLANRSQSAPSGGGEGSGEGSGESSNQAMTCMTAATATLQTVMKGLSIRESKKVLKESKKNIAEFDSNYQNRITIDPNLTERVLPRVVVAGDGGSDLGGGAGGGDTPPPSIGPGGDASGSLDIRGDMMSAIARNGGLPPTLRDSAMHDAYQNAFGQSLDSILDGLDPESSAAGMIGGALSKTPIASDLSKTGLADELRRLEREGLSLSGGRSLASYSGGGGGRKPGTSDPFGEELNGLMQGLVGSLLNPDGTKKDQGAMSGANELRFQHLRNKKADEIVNDPSISLFDRVSFRYHESRGTHLDQVPWASRHNQLIHQDSSATGR